MWTSHDFSNFTLLAGRRKQGDEPIDVSRGDVYREVNSGGKMYAKAKNCMMQSFQDEHGDVDHRSKDRGAAANIQVQ